MLPGGFVDCSKKTDDFVLVGPVVEKVGDGADGSDDDNAKPEIKDVIHEDIIA